jgi:transcription initiation factor IIE alpha subunit
MKKHFRGASRREMEHAGRALPKKVYQCGPCGVKLTHDECSRHFFTCPQRTGSTVKRPAR